MPLDSTNFEQQDAQLISLHKAREQLAREGGWCQEIGYTFGGAACLMMALRDAAGSEPERVALYGLVAADLPDSDPDGYGLPQSRITAWNDTPGRTQAEVVAVIDGAIVRRTAPRSGA